MLEAAFLSSGIAIAVALGVATVVAKFFAQRMAQKTLKKANLDRLDDLDGDFSSMRADFKLLRICFLALDEKIKSLSAKNASKVP